MSVYRIVPKPGEEPHEWRSEKFEEINGDEMFIRHVTELHTIVDATLIVDQQRDDVKSAVTSILLNGLMPAFAELQNIRASHRRPLPLMNQRELYHDF